VRILVFGAGVVGQVYGARLAEAGHDVTLLARGETLARLSSRGVSLDAGRGELLHARPAVVAEPPHGESYDLLLATVRRDQLEGALPLLAELPAERAALMLNCPLGLESAGASLGTGRTLFAFPGIGGYRSEDGTIRYIEVPQQKTTVGGDGGDEQILVDLLRSAGFPVDLTDEVEGWLKTHAAFIAALGAAILEAGGDSAVLAADPARLRTMVTAVGEGFRALARNGVAVTPPLHPPAALRGRPLLARPAPWPGRHRRDRAPRASLARHRAAAALLRRPPARRRRRPDAAPHAAARHRGRTGVNSLTERPRPGQTQTRRRPGPRSLRAQQPRCGAGRFH